MASTNDDLGIVLSDSRERDLKCFCLVVDICNVLDEMDVVAKIIGQYPPENILCNIVPKTMWFVTALFQIQCYIPRVAHVRRVVHGRTAIVPFDSSTISRDELSLCKQETFRLITTRAAIYRALSFVSKNYTLSVVAPLFRALVTSRVVAGQTSCRKHEQVKAQRSLEAVLKTCWNSKMLEYESRVAFS